MLDQVNEISRPSKGIEFADIKNNEDIYSLISDSMENLLVVLNPFGHIVDINNYAKKILGFDQSINLCGLSWIDNFVPARMRESGRKIFSGVLNRKDFDLKSINPILTANNDEIIIDWRNRLIDDFNNKIMAVLSVGYDITDYLDLRGQLLNEYEENRFLADLLRQSPDPVIALNLADFRICFSSENLNSILSAQDGQIIGKNINEFLSVDSCGKLTIAVESLMLQNNLNVEAKNQSTIIDIQEPLRNDNNKLVDLQLTLSLYRSESGKAVKAICLLKDVTEKKKSEKRFAQAHKLEAIGTLAGGIAHDFNNTLGVIIGNAELALNGNLNIDKRLNTILQAGLRAKELTGQILNFSRLRETAKQLIRIDTITKEAIKFLRSTVPTSVDIQYNCANDLGMILGDATHIYRLLINLGVNARHALKGCHDPKMIVNLQNIVINENSPQRKNYILISVSDNGYGIPVEIQDRIFDPFFTTKEDDQGTGMGLAIVHEIVQGHNGFIDLQSQQGQGTIFKIYLPAVDNPTQAIKVTKEELIPGKGKILFVDDEKDILEVYESLLSDLGYSVSCCKTPFEAIELFKSDPESYNLVITDMAMPKISGLELVDTLRMIRPDIKIIINTGYSDEINVDILNVKNLTLLLKPILLTDLSTTVAKAIQK